MIKQLFGSGMTLSSAAFLVFLGVCVVLYYLLPRRWRNPFLLVASYLFYCINAWQYALLLLAATCLSYGAARAIGASGNPRRRKAQLLGGITLLVAILAFFKYLLGPLASGLYAGGAIAESVFNKLVFPVGISFYTFQVIGYLIDVYNKKTQAEHSFINYALFVSFFPQILSGPIGRAGELLPQYRRPNDFNADNIAAGCQRFLLGAFRKVVIADGLSKIVNGVFGNLSDHRGPMLITAVLLFVLQLYFDFSGYTDMAIGAARMLGFTLRENFKTPYLATNRTGLWQRWHMSLTSWLTDYIFTPLVWSRWVNKLFFGKRADEHKPAVIVNIFIVFLISGAWHGNTLNFIIWGLLEGLFRAGEELVLRARKRRGKRPKKNENILVVTIKRLWVYLTWAGTHVFFRTGSLSEALYVFRESSKSMSFYWYKSELFRLIAGGEGYRITVINLYFFVLILALVIMAALDHRISPQNADNNALAAIKSKKWRWALYWIMGISIMLFYMMAMVTGPPPFIYAGH